MALLQIREGEWPVMSLGPVRPCRRYNLGTTTTRNNEKPCVWIGRPFLDLGGQEWKLLLLVVKGAISKDWWQIHSSSYEGGVMSRLDIIVASRSFDHEQSRSVMATILNQLICEKVPDVSQTNVSTEE